MVQPIFSSSVVNTEDLAAARMDSGRGIDSTGLEQVSVRASCGDATQSPKSHDLRYAWVSFKALEEQ